MKTKKGIIASKLIAATALLAILAACTTTGMTRGAPDSRRQAIQEMRQEVLAELYSIKPDTRGQIADASGYAVFRMQILISFLPASAEASA